MSTNTYTYLLLFILHLATESAYGYSLQQNFTLKRQGKIVGGEIINIEQAPFNVALEYLSRQICGGAALSQRWAVTAAHCFGKGIFLKSQAIVRAGSGQRHSGGTEHNVKQIIKHPDFVVKVINNDVALMELYPPLIFSNKIAPIHLPTFFQKPREKDLVQVYGFGYTKESGDPSHYLRTVYLPVYNHDECTRLYRDTLSVTNQMLCAGYREGGRDACVLDSGGPLVWRGKLHGIVSWGWGCARELHPGVFTDLTSPLVREWISQHLRK